MSIGLLSRVKVEVICHIRPRFIAVWGFSLLILAVAVPAFAEEPKSPASRQDAIAPEAEDLETSPADTSRVLLARFRKENPEAREHTLAMTSEAFAEDPSNPALRLERVWCSDKATLLEIVGLSRVGQPNSASVAPESLRLYDLKSGASAKLLSHEGVTEVKNRRGGSALIVKPGEKLYLLMEPIDDWQPHSLDYLGWDGRQGKYFDRIDPRFRERYDTAFAQASSPAATPEHMKDFLVEFARDDPDKRALKVFQSLINKMRAQNSFEGHYNAYLFMKDTADAKAAMRLVQTEEQRRKMENIAVSTLADKSRLLDMDLKIETSQIATNEGSCLMFCNYNFAATKGVSGTLTVRAKRDKTPIRLKIGTYKVTFSTELHVPKWGVQDSSWAGSFNRRSDDRISKTVSVTLAPPNYTATLPINFGQIELAFFQRGSYGGYTAYWANGDAKVSVRFKSMELVQ